MAKHSLVAGQDLITALEKLGSALGYNSVTEYPIDPKKSNPQAIDVVWKRDEEQRFPLMVFEVESTASNAAANNPLKLYSKRNFEKPLFFFHVFIDVGKHTARLDDLREQYGKMNYRIYTLSKGDIPSVLTDILGQHRRLTDRLDVIAFVHALRQHCLAHTDCHANLAHAECLGFNKGQGATLPAYARLCAEDPSFIQDFYRYLTNRRKGLVKSESDRYGTYFGECWETPLYYGILSSLQTDPTAPTFFDHFRRWHEQPEGPYLRVGPWFGLNVDFNDFLAYLAAPFMAVLAALMADVPGAACYMAEQLQRVLGEIKSECLAVRSHIALWMFHLYSSDPQSSSPFEELRSWVNSQGGVAEQFLRQPYGGLPFAHLDPDADVAFRHARVPVPPLPEFRNCFMSGIDASERRIHSVCLAMRLMTDDDTLDDWAENLVPLLHARITTQHAEPSS